MSDPLPLLHLQDLDLLAGELRDPRAVSRLRKLGFEVRSLEPLERERTRRLEAVEKRWLGSYERALKRYGRGVAAVRERVCLGCFITLPTSAAPGAAETVTMCESCGRILYWR